MPYLRSIRAAVVLLSLGLAGALATAAAPPPANDPLAAPAFTADPAALLAAAEGLEEPEDATADVLLREVELSIDAENRTTYRQRTVYRVLDDEAAGSEIEMGYAPWYQERPTLRARVVRPNGEVYELDPATVEDSGTGGTDLTVYSDHRRVRAPLPGIAPGAVVETEIVRTDHRAFSAAGAQWRERLAFTEPVRRLRFTAERSGGGPLLHRVSRLDGVEPTIESDGDRTLLVLELEDVPAHDFEWSLPPDVAPAPQIEIGSAASWAEVAREYAATVEGRLAAAEETERYLKLAEARGESRRETIARLLDRLHDQVRYTSVAFGAAAIVPATPSETLDRGYGDCKDKSLLLVAALRRAGIEARLALLRAGADEDVRPSLPGLGLFNHVIVHLPAAGDEPELWIDATDPYSALGDLPAPDQGRWALVVAEETTELVRIPGPAPESNRLVQTRDVHLAPLEPARVVEREERTGAFAAQLRAWIDGGADAFREQLESYAEESYLAEELGEVSHSSPSDRLGPAWLELEVPEVGTAAADLDEAALVLDATPVFEHLPWYLTYNDLEERQEDLYMTAPFVAEVRHRLHPPAGYQPRELEDVELAFGPLTYERRYRRHDDGTVEVVYRLDTGAARWSVEDARIAQEGLEELLAEPQDVLILAGVVSGHLDRGDPSAAIAAARDHLAAAPDDPVASVQLARALLAGGLGDAARRQIAEAAERAPDHAQVHWLASQIYSHDALGRPYGRGFDRAAGIAAAERALELDPDHLDARLALANLLERDREGLTYPPGDDLERAIELYREVGDEVEGTEFELNLPIALFFAERFEETLEALPEMPTDATRAALLLAARAAVDGTESALEALEPMLASFEDRVPVLTGAGANLQMVRLYPEAGALFRAASRLTAQPAATLQAARIFGEARPIDRPPTADTPEGLAWRYYFYGLRGMGDDPPGELLASVLLDALEPDGGLDATEAVERLLEARRPHQVGIAVEQAMNFDLLRPQVELRVDGDDEGGYVIRSSNGTSRTLLYAVREGDGYRLVGGTRAAGGLGHVALHELDRDRPEIARRWLERARDHYPDDPRPETGHGQLAALLDEASADEAPHESLRAAALALAAHLSAETALIEALRERYRAASGDERIRWGMLIVAFVEADERAEILPELIEAFPSSETLRRFHIGSLFFAGRRDEALERAREWVEEDPDAAERHLTIAGFLTAMGELAEGRRHLLAALAADEPPPGVYNELAWLGAAEGKIDARTLGWGHKSVEVERGYSTLHTLATLYALECETATAHRVLLEAHGEVPAGEVGDPDWLVLGLLAECYGLPEIAADYYTRMERPEEPSPIESWSIAQRRLAGLPDQPATALASP